MPVTLIKKPRAAAAAAAAAAAKPALDYPSRNETISSDHYSVRVTVPEGTAEVEIAIDGGPWEACRDSSGHRWFDWTGFGDGKHEIRARMRTSDGRWSECSPRTVTVRRG